MRRFIVPLLLCSLALPATASATTGGPSTSGYTFIDNAEYNGPAFNWRTTSTALNLGADDSTSVSLPFPFTFFGQTYNSVLVNSDGVLSFGTTNTISYNSTCLPAAQPGAHIFALWDDLDPTYSDSTWGVASDDVYWSVEGATGDRVFTVEWRAIYHYILLFYTGDNPVDFQVQLFESDNHVEVHFEDAFFNYSDWDYGLAATLGIQSSTGEALSYSCNGSNLVQNGRVIGYYPDGTFDSDGDGYTGDMGDCDDTDDAVFPGNAEVCDGVDNNCAGGADEGFDVDGDGYSTCGADGIPGTSDDDCNDNDASVFSGGVEVCDAIDNDCDGTVDDGFDTDVDGVTTCGPNGVAGDSDDDCDDARNTVRPGATESCDGLDQDCDGAADEGFDADSDGWSTCGPDGTPGNSDDDCNDSVSTIHPTATEVCDGIDNNCSGATDEGFDIDGDGYTTCGGDCNDNHAMVFPGGLEVCNGLDDNCDGSTDEGFDVDSDGYTSCAGDCNDNNPNIHAGATEQCDGVDEDCDGTVDDGFDTDFDGYTACGGDCDDSAGGVHPGATELCNGVDDDCDSAVDEGFDADYDGFSACGDDCDDDDGDVYPGAPEPCNGIDDDCDGSTDEGHDADADGYTTCGVDGLSPTADDDCDDTVASTHPGATEACNGVDDDCDGEADEALDGDGDGFTACGGDCDDGDADVNPDADEVPYDGVDNDCDGGDLVDIDGDGTPGGSIGPDCDDRDDETHPGATEEADGVDQDCDGVVDEGTDQYDDDGDGFTELGGDCDDDDDEAAPAVAEVCDGVDNDCDGDVDEGTDCVDDDGDGAAEDEGDCDDEDDAIGPGVAEVPANGIDDDCDGTVDDGTLDPDGDGWTADAGDCDDGDSSIYPGAQETCDGADEDCDGATDEDTSCADDDGDGASEDEGDCDDDDADRAPGANEVLNGIDDDCDGEVDEGSERSDDDGDGYSEEGGDCDDADSTRSPAAFEADNGVDDDCDGDIDEGFVDADGDGFTTDGGDCDDTEGWANPDRAEVCDEIDNDCDGDIDEGCGEGSELPADNQEPSSGCSTAGGSSPGLLALLTGAALVLLRRRPTLPLVSLLLAGCGGDVTVARSYPELVATPALRDLGDVEVGTTVTFPIHLDARNGEVVVQNAAVLNVDGDFFELLPQDMPVVNGTTEASLELSYSPTSVGWHQATLTIASDGQEPTIDVVVRAHAVEPTLFVGPSIIDFGAVPVSAALSATVTIHNRGETQAVVTGWDTGSTLFTVTSAFPVEVGPGGQADVTVQFLPLDAQSAATELVLQRDDHGLNPVILRGNACATGTPDVYDVDGDGVTSCGGDCDDHDATVHPGAAELVNGEDDDCDGEDDEGTAAYDDDGDGFSEDQGDCADYDDAVSPSATEVWGNGIDDDCDGAVDAGTTDTDGDGYSDLGGDCDDGDDTRYPHAPELDDGLDNDCDGVTDEGTSGTDDDGDGQSEDQGDCDDGDAEIYDGADELADWRDNDCDGEIDEGTDHADDDGDGFSEDGGDCDDGDADVHPAATEISANGLDDDCDGIYE